MIYERKYDGLIFFHPPPLDMATYQPQTIISVVILFYTIKWSL